MDDLATRNSSSDNVGPDQLNDAQDGFESLDIAFDDRLFQDSIGQLAAPVQDPQFNQIQEPLSLNTEDGVSDTRGGSRGDGKLNFDVLMKRCEDDMDLVTAVLEAFCWQGSASCTALDLALEMNDQKQLLLQAV
jgi:hypothetical protein